MNSSIEANPTEGEKLTGVIETDGRLVLTIVAEAKAEEVFGWENVIEPGTQTVYTIEIDAETFMAYEPSEEMLQVINGTDKTVTLIADPGTEQEKTYVKSCGGNGELYVLPAEGYRYKDGCNILTLKKHLS